MSPRRQKLLDLRTTTPHILPSLLLCDFGNLRREVQRLTDAGVQALHLDVMDGHFVPNLTYGMPIVSALRGLTDLTLDVHLMIQNPDRYIQAFIDAGADVLTIHVEAVPNPRPVLERIREAGAAAGLALNPGTPLETVLPHGEACDLVLVMSVPAGFGGQAFHPVAVDKLRRLREESSADFMLQVDGGINASTIGACAQAGAELFVVGSAIFGQQDYQVAVRQLHSLAT